MELQVVDIILYVLASSGASAWVATALADLAKSDNKVLKSIGIIINTFGGNVFKAQNK